MHPRRPTIRTLITTTPGRIAQRQGVGPLQRSAPGHQPAGRSNQDVLVEAVEAVGDRVHVVGCEPGRASGTLLGTLLSPTQKRLPHTPRRAVQPRVTCRVKLLSTWTAHGWKGNGVAEFRRWGAWHPFVAPFRGTLSMGCLATFGLFGLPLARCQGSCGRISKRRCRCSRWHRRPWHPAQPDASSLAAPTI